MNKHIKYYEVQDWNGNVLHTCDTLDKADEYKLSICKTDSEMEDIYIIGFDEEGNEHAPQW